MALSRRGGRHCLMEDGAIHLLLVEDHLPDVKLTRRAFAESAIEHSIDVVYDGVEALSYLRREDRYKSAPVPDLVILDLNMPRMDGRHVLREMATDPNLRQIPVLVLTTSGAAQDVSDAYHLGANAYIVKPVSYPDFQSAISVLGTFWMRVATLPPIPNPSED